MSTELLENFDKKVIERAKEYFDRDLAKWRASRKCKNINCQVFPQIELAKMHYVYN
ncbi:MAG: hypothetical protein ACE5J3_01705 [Methanosarcinales archaeon]